MRLQVIWGGAIVIDDELTSVEPNRYFYLRMEDGSHRPGSGSTKIDRMFEINRTTLEYAFGISMKQGYWTSDGSCESLRPRI
jgi:hypothetical protein